ncbi:Small nuclear ribonucleoprotein-associated protein B [Penicillium argentinense]|uniref:Sm protein B n=1 Tax=Penicillium argentinense TaxID=1131581 RepID=A0A9W9EZD1_9EURO|nr:Small nuclear ribonucleoprotein-associated protein B [Penicillium argentinense]KAJ5090738.1 Small nuclear ribonucleoprotein-associated protein B [Penicillium argentinense]
MAPKQQQLINYRMRVYLKDDREIEGEILTFDKHQNVVLADAEEFRTPKPQSGRNAPDHPPKEKRTLGLIIIRGSQVMSIAVVGKPPANPTARLATKGPGAGGAATTLAAGPGVSRPAGRGLPIGLTGPAAGVGGPAPALPNSFPGGPPPGFAGRGGPGGPPIYSFINCHVSQPVSSRLPVSKALRLQVALPPTNWQLPPGFAPPPGFQPGPPGQGRGHPPGFGGH